MKKYIITAIIVLCGILMQSEYVTAEPLVYSCNNGDCITSVFQYEQSWSMHIDCGDEYHYYSGSGCYEGTICGGMTNPIFCEV
jgi:hypothetical protein